MLHKYFLIAAVLLLHVLHSVARPTASDGNHTNILQSRQCVWNEQKQKFDCDDNLPTVDEIIYHMRNDKNSRANKDHSACFYSELGDFVPGPRGPALWISTWPVKAQIGWYWLYNVVPMERGNWYPVTAAWAQIASAKPEYAERWGYGPKETLAMCWYQALSQAAVHSDAYVFTRKEVVNFHPGTTWSRVELPYLTQNPNIKRIWRVDPRPPTAGGTSCGKVSERELFWDRSRGDKVLQADFVCPVKPLAATTTTAAATSAAAATTS